jgi:hypothetical protein
MYRTAVSTRNTPLTPVDKPFDSHLMECCSLSHHKAAVCDHARSHLMQQQLDL